MIVNFSTLFFIPTPSPFCYNGSMRKIDTKNVLLGVAIPVALQNLITFSLNFVDTAMISYVSEEALAAVSLANQVFFLMILIVFGITSGSGAFLSQFLGKGDEDNIKRTVAATLLFAAIVGALAMILAMLFGRQIMGLLIQNDAVIDLGSRYLLWVAPSYFFTALASTFMVATRSIGRARIAMVSSLISVLTNIVLDYLLIFGHAGFPRMGVEGAALATTLARVLELALMAALVYRVEPLIAPGLRHFRALSRRFIRAILTTSFPVVINESMWALGIILYTVNLGFLGQGSVAAFQLMRNLYNFFDVGFFGLASAAQVLIGVAIGSARPEEAKRTAKTFMKYNILASIGFSLIIFLISPLMLRVFSLSEETRQMAVQMMMVQGAFLTIKNINLLFIVGIARGGGDTHYAMLIEILGVWGVGVPMAFLGALILGLSPVQVVVLLQAEEVGKAFLSLKRLKNHKWIHNLTGSFEERKVA